MRPQGIHRILFAQSGIVTVLFRLVSNLLPACTCKLWKTVLWNIFGRKIIRCNSLPSLSLPLFFLSSNFNALSEFCCIIYGCCCQSGCFWHRTTIRTIANTDALFVSVGAWPSLVGRLTCFKFIITVPFFGFIAFCYLLQNLSCSRNCT